MKARELREWLDGAIDQGYGERQVKVNILQHGGLHQTTLPVEQLSLIGVKGTGEEAYTASFVCLTVPSLS